MAEKLDKDGRDLNRFLEDYKKTKFDKPGVSADNVVFSLKDGKAVVLLIKRGNHPFIGQWALPGGFLSEGESLENAAARELFEETGLEGIAPKQLYTVSTPKRDPRGWTVSAVFLSVIKDPVAVRGADDASDAGWFFIDYVADGDIYNFILKDGSGAELYPKIKVVRDKDNTIDINKTEIISGGDVAFDHAKLILYAIEHL